MRSILLVLSIFIRLTIQDCNLNPYPRQVITGSVTALINQDPSIHGMYLQFDQSVGVNLVGDPQAAVGIIGMDSFFNNNTSFRVQYENINQPNIARFNVMVQSLTNEWNQIRFTYILSTNQLLQAQTFAFESNRFSRSLSKGPNYNYTIYFQPNSNIITLKPTIRYFLNGVNLTYNGLGQTSTSSNMNIQKLFNPTRNIYVKIINLNTIGKFFSLKFQSNCNISWLQFSYIGYVESTFTEQNNVVSGVVDFSGGRLSLAVNALNDMGMMMFGLAGISLSRGASTGLLINTQIRNGKLNFTLSQSNVASMSYIALLIKDDFACSDCDSGKIIFKGRLCVSACPLQHSLKYINNVQYCSSCSMEDMKVVSDQGINGCSCSERYYLNPRLDVCFPCRYDCLTCTEDAKCLSCDTALLVTNRKFVNGNCVCKPGYYDDKVNIKCGKCSDTCSTCSGPRQNQCLTCSLQRQLDFRNFCICKNGFIGDEKGSCFCQQPAALTGNKLCLFKNLLACAPKSSRKNNISKCICDSGFNDIGDRCIQCEKNQIFQPHQNSCVCQSEMFRNRSGCFPCPLGASYEAQTNKCVCKNGSFLNQLDGSCVNCGRNMIWNGDQDECACIRGYYKVDDLNCNKCTISKCTGPSSNS